MQFMRLQRRSSYITIPSRESYIFHVKEKFDNAKIEKVINALLREGVADQTGDAFQDTAQAVRLFHEFFERLVIRYAEVLQSEYEMIMWDQTDMRRSMRDVQTEFVNRTEAFVQQSYASMSSFIKLLSHTDKQSTFIRNMPSYSVSKFLVYMREQIPVLKDSIAVLENALTEYRSTYIDHTNQNAVHDWYTHGLIDKARIVYCTGRGRGTRMKIPELRIKDFEITTPSPVESYFVAPHHNEVIGSLLQFYTGVLDYLVQLRISSN